jgi:hypothetical protein
VRRGRLRRGAGSGHRYCDERLKETLHHEVLCDGAYAQVDEKEMYLN